MADTVHGGVTGIRVVLVEQQDPVTAADDPALAKQHSVAARNVAEGRVERRCVPKEDPVETIPKVG